MFMCTCSRSYCTNLRIHHVCNPVNVHTVVSMHGCVRCCVQLLNSDCLLHFGVRHELWGSHAFPQRLPEGCL